MIAIAKLTGTVVRNAEVVNGTVLDPNGINGDVDFFDLYYTQEELQQRIEAAVAEHEQSHLEVLQGWHDECEKLKSRIAELEAAQQPVEVSAELDKAIEDISKELHWAAKFLDTQSEAIISIRKRWLQQ